MDEKPHYWFAAKRYGWGWGLPLCWQGWVVYIVWIVTMSAAAVYLRHSVPLFVRLAFILGMSVLLLGICYWKGEPPRWRWGD
jgi:hypothetical protein